MAIPGSIVASGKLVTPGGAAGPVGPPGPNVVSADAGNIATLGSDNLILVPQQTIWYQRLRAYNSLGNPNFEVTQRNIGNSISNPSHGSLLEDRWIAQNNGSLNPLFQRGLITMSPGNGIVVPGTSFAITTAIMRVTVQTTKASLAATDLLGISQTVEGPCFRELMNDVHSVSLLVRSSVANLNFGLSLRDTSVARSLTKLCTLGAANTFTLITLPNLPIWPSGGSFTPSVGSPGYQLGIMLGAGTTYTAPANDTWQNGNFLGAAGQSNFAASPVNSTFDIAFVQHEPGALCSTFIDKPFTRNLEECLRYYQKSYDYGVAVGTAGAVGPKTFIAHTATTSAYGSSPFYKPMAKTPTVTLFDNNSGAANSVMDNAGVHHTGASANIMTSTGIGGITFTTATTAIMPVFFHYTADTGW